MAIPSRSTSARFMQIFPLSSRSIEHGQWSRMLEMRSMRALTGFVSEKWFHSRLTLGLKERLRGNFKGSREFGGLSAKAPARSILRVWGYHELRFWWETRRVMMREKVYKERRRRRNCLKLENIVEEGVMQRGSDKPRNTPRVVL